MKEEKSLSRREMLDCMNCFQTAYAPLCIQNGVDPSIMFLWGWSFNYKENGESVFNNFGVNYSMDTIQFLKVYAGLESVEIINDLNLNDYSKIIKGNLEQQRGIVIGIDAFYCNWNLAYKRMHIDHYVNVIGVKLNGKLICKDWYENTEELYELNIEDFVGIYSIRSISFGEVANNREVLEELKKAYIDKNNIFMNFEKFIKGIKSVEGINKLFEDNNPKLCRLLIYAREYKCYRKGIYCYLDMRFIQNGENNNCERLKDCFQKLERMWGKLISILIKICISKKLDENREKLISIIKEIEAQEIDTWKVCNEVI